MGRLISLVDEIQFMLISLFRARKIKRQALRSLFTRSQGGYDLQGKNQTRTTTTTTTTTNNRRALTSSLTHRHHSRVHTLLCTARDTGRQSTCGT